MKIYDIISESNEIDEAPVGWTKQKLRGLGARMGSRSAATAKATGDEANDLKAELSAWMKGSQISKGQLTVDDLEEFLTLKGYEGVAKTLLVNLRKKAVDKAATRSDRMQAVGYRAGQAAGAVGRAAQKVGSAIKSASGVNPPDTVSEDSADPATAPLTNAEVDKVLSGVVAHGYRSGANLERGRFAKPVAAAADAGALDLNAIDPNEAKVIAALQARGYKITK